MGLKSAEQSGQCCSLPIPPDGPSPSSRRGRRAKMRSVGLMIGALCNGEHAAAPEVWRLAFGSTAPQDLLLAIVTQQRDV